MSTLAPNPGFPAVRMRRLRRTDALRRFTAEGGPQPRQLVQPLFVREGITEPRPILSMPGVQQHTLVSVRKAAAEAAAVGVGAVMVFGVPTTKDPLGTGAYDPDGIGQLALREVAAEVGDALVVIGDINLDEYTDHGHVGVLDASGDVDNDRTLAAFAQVAIAQAEAGAQVVAPSGMMDGQVAAIREALDAAGLAHVAILGYTAKYASGFYGPFRDAVNSSLRGHRKSHQQHPANVRESRREITLDLAEGADMVMVKPASHYLDIVAMAARLSDVPVAAYQVSGEYAMLEAAAAHGWINRDTAVIESLTCIHRAGADAVITYYATEFASRLAG